MGLLWRGLSSPLHSSGEAQEARRDGPQGKGRGPRHGKGEVEVALPRIQRLRGPPLPLAPQAPLSLFLQVGCGRGDRVYIVGYTV